jgi:hypothetical protein
MAGGGRNLVRTFLQPNSLLTEKNTGNLGLQWRVGEARNAHKITEVDRSGIVTRIAPDKVRWGGKRL